MHHAAEVSNRVDALLLGVAQDAGVPQAGCTCSHCQRAHAEASLRQHVVCLGLIDHALRQLWLIDATPDFREQLYRLQSAAPGYALAGIVLTHAHMGHYTGLIHLGREAWNSGGLPVYASAAMCAFLRTHAPWSQLLALRNMELHPLTAHQRVALSPNVHLTPLPVPHRNEWSDTLAYLVHGPARTLFYCPDIDDWGRWERRLVDVLAGADVALLDGCFFGADEVPGRNLAEIPHPLVQETVAHLAGAAKGCATYFIHLNHTNPLYHAGPERQWLVAQGYGVGQTGQQWRL